MILVTLCPSYKADSSISLHDVLHVWTDSLKSNDSLTKTAKLLIYLDSCFSADQLVCGQVNLLKNSTGTSVVLCCPVVQVYSYIRCNLQGALTRLATSNVTHEQLFIIWWH